MYTLRALQIDQLLCYHWISSRGANTIICRDCGSH